MISDVTITYNNKTGLVRTLESLLCQTSANYEVIIIDGGSSDGSIDVIKDYKEKFDAKNIPYKYVSESDKGRYDAMNKGINLANGEWIMFLNAGDTLSSNDVIKSVSGYLDDTGADIVYGDNNRCYDGAKEYHKAGQNLEYIKKGLPFNHQSVFTRTSLFKQRGYNIKYQISGDYEWFLYAYLSGYSFEYAPICISDFYMDGISGSSRYENYKEVLKIRKEHGVQDFFVVRWAKSFVWWLIDVFKIDNRKVVARIDIRE